MNTHILPIWEIALRLVISAILGSLVGWDRQSKEGAAGLRTHMLVCVGSTLIMIVSAFGFDDILGRPDVVLDPSRIAAQVVTGIGFLGAGTIIFLRQQVIRGLTTAAGLWSVAAVGLAIGGGMYSAAIIATLIILLILAALKPLENKMFKHDSLRTILLTLDIKQVSLMEIESTVKNKGLEIAEIILDKISDTDIFHMKLTFENSADRTSILEIVKDLNSKPGVSGLNLNI